MLHVSLFIELLRQQPQLIFWFVTLTQAALWVLVPALFYAAPPGGVPHVLAIGHEFAFAPQAGPPLAYWLAEFAFSLAGNRAIGVYALSQICVVVTYWAVFMLGRAAVGERQAALAVVAMIGISAVSLPTPDFGPAILLMPLWALSVLHLWRAIGEERRGYWLLLAADLSLLLLTSYLSLVLLALLAAFVVIHPRIRTKLWAPEPCAAGLILLFMMLPMLVLLAQTGEELAPRFARLRNIESIPQNVLAWLRLASTFVLSHAGLAILIGIAANVARLRSAPAPFVERPSVNILARDLIYYVALATPLALTLAAATAGYTRASLNPAPLAIFSTLAIVLAAGRRITLHNQRLLGFAWAGLLFVPPLFAAVSVPVAPWIFGIDLKVAQPAAELGRFFTENFERRTGQRLAIVAGDPQLAALIALASPHRPHLLSDQPDFPNTVSAKDVAEKGAVVVWPATDAGGSPPPEIKARFPELAPEVPRAFERPIEGRLPLLRVGWAMIRPTAPPPQ